MIKKILLTILLSIVAYANPITVDSLVPQLKIKDQFEKEHTLDVNIKTIIFTSNKGTSDMLRDYILSHGGDDFLNKNNIAYIADISGMPSIITKFVALPKMKKYPFPILLLDDTNKDNFMKDDGKVVVYSLDEGKVTKISEATTTEELENLLK